MLRDEVKGSWGWASADFNVRGLVWIGGLVDKEFQIGSKNCIQEIEVNTNGPWIITACTRERWKVLVYPTTEWNLGQAAIV